MKVTFVQVSAQCINSNPKQFSIDTNPDMFAQTGLAAKAMYKCKILPLYIRSVINELRFCKNEISRITTSALNLIFLLK